MEEMRPKAYKSMSNYGGIEILSYRDEHVAVRDNYGKPSRAAWSKIRYDAKGESYFMHRGRREYLNEYIRCSAVALEIE